MEARVHKELTDLSSNPIPGVYVGIVDSFTYNI